MYRSFKDLDRQEGIEATTYSNFGAGGFEPNKLPLSRFLMFMLTVSWWKPLESTLAGSFGY